MGDQLPSDAYDLDPETVRGRFRWAREQGNPMWVWPDTTVERWQAALAQIESVTRQVLNAGRDLSTLDGDPDDLSIAAYTSGMGPLLGYWARCGLIQPAPHVRPMLELHYRHNLERISRLGQHAISAVNALVDQGIRVTVLKGMHTAHAYFPTPAARPLADIDLLVDAGDQPRAASVLSRLGYLPQRGRLGEQQWRQPHAPLHPRSLSLAHRDDPWDIDLHTSLDRLHAAGAPMICLDRAIEGAPLRHWALNSRGHVLSATALILHLACHASQDHRSLSLLRLTELVLVIRQSEQTGDLCWDDFARMGQQTGTIANAYPALQMTSQLVPGAVPDAILQRMESEAPAAVRRVVGRLTPATCQSVGRFSLEERYMWIKDLPGVIRQASKEFFPEHLTLEELLRFYGVRFWRIARRAVTM